MTDVAHYTALVRRWETLYNEDHDRMADECYAEDVNARAMGFDGVLEGRAQLRFAANAVLQIAPKRLMRVDHIHVSGNVAVAEAVLLDADQGPDWQSPFCAVLTFRDDRIVSDRTYLDLRNWPGIRDTLPQ